MKRYKGFTLIELMIVVAIIGILASVAFPAYQNYAKRAKVAEALTLASAARTSVVEYYSTMGEWPANAESAGLPAVISSDYVRQLFISNGTIAVQLDTSLANNNALVSGVLLLRPVASGGSITWTCTSVMVDTEILPARCR